MASQDIAYDIRFIRQYLKVIAEKDERLSTGTLVHGRAYVEACAGWLPQTVARYLRNLRAISECELAMTAAGIRFALSSASISSTPFASAVLEITNPSSVARRVSPVLALMQVSVPGQ